MIISSDFINIIFISLLIYNNEILLHRLLYNINIILYIEFINLYGNYFINNNFDYDMVIFIN